EPDTLDVHVSPWAVAANVGLNIFDTLVIQDPTDASYKPGLAESWEVAPDGTSYTFKLRSGVTFHDGTPLDAEALKFNFDRIADPATKSGFAASLLGPYAGSEVVDPLTVRVTFKEPYAPLLDSLSQAFLGIVSPAAVQKFGTDFGVNPVGAGPFVFKEWAKQDHLTLVKNPDYTWASPVFAHQGAAYLDEVTFKFIPESATRTGTLESGETALIEAVAESDLEIVQGEGYQLLVGQAPGLPTTLLINTAKAPTDDPAVRRALIQATDAQEIIDTVFFGAYNRATAPLATVSWAYNPEVAPVFAFDPEGAAKTLDEAGWTLNGEYREKGGQRLAIDFFFSAAWDGGTYGELWQSQLRKIGIELTIKQIDVSARIETAQNGQTNIVANGWISSDPIILEHLFHSKNIGVGYSWTFYKDPQLDQILDQGRAEVDHDKRKALYAQAQQIIADQSLVVPLADLASLNGLRASVHDVKIDSRGWYRWLYDAWVEQ
ncbi:MAG TPA: ABC transporter substrate-binding protein, partial [Thermomicrobiales bacterium]|nr:ABC transporter substrate-binding protein [Thermomicrobiales bacterium]